MQGESHLSCSTGVLSGTVCGVLLLCRGLAVALAMDALPRLNLVTLEAVPLLVSLHATSQTFVVVVPTIPLCLHTSSLGILARVVQISNPVRLGPRSRHRPSVTPFCCSSTFSIFGLDYSFVPPVAAWQ